MEREPSKNAGGDEARPCPGPRRAYRHHQQDRGVRLRPPQLAPLSAEQADEAVAALSELVARHLDRSGS